MKNILITLTAVAAIATTHGSVQIIRKSTPEEVEQEQRKLEMILQRWEKAKAGDDKALKEHILGIEPHFHGGFSYVKIAKEIVEEGGISRERMIKALDSIIRESIPILEEWLSDKDNRDGFKIGTKGPPRSPHTNFTISVRMLEGLPGEDTLALYGEYITLTTVGNFTHRRLTYIRDDMKASIEALQKEAQRQDAPKADGDMPTEQK